MHGGGLYGSAVRQPPHPSTSSRMLSHLLMDRLMSAMELTPPNQPQTTSCTAMLCDSAARFTYVRCTAVLYDRFIVAHLQPYAKPPVHGLVDQRHGAHGVQQRGVVGHGAGLGGGEDASERRAVRLGGTKYWCWWAGPCRWGAGARKTCQRLRLAAVARVRQPLAAAVREADPARGHPLITNS